MPGYRIRLKPEWDHTIPDDALIVERDITRPLPAPTKPDKRTNGRVPTLEEIQPVCSKCGVQHFHKTYHLQLRAGSVIVSETIWGQLQKLRPQRWELLNTVDDPPAQRIGPGIEPQLVEKVPQPITAALLGNGYSGPR